MGRSLSVILILILLCLTITSCGNKNASDQGTSAGNQTPVELAPMTEKITPASEAKPTSDENSVGLMAFYPNSSNENMYALAGTNTLTFYFQRKRVKLGSGYLYLYDAIYDENYDTVSASDSAAFNIKDIDEIGKTMTGWNEGTMIDVYFDKPFLAGGKYYVLIDEGFFMLGAFRSRAVDVSKRELITFGVKNYGIDAASVNLNRDYHIGDTINMNVIVDGEQSTICALKEYDTNFLSASPINITADGTSDATTLSISFKQAGTPSITLEFCKAGKTVDTISFNFNVIGDTVLSSEEENTTSGTSAPTSQSISQSSTQIQSGTSAVSQSNPSQNTSGGNQSAGMIQNSTQQKSAVSQQPTQNTGGYSTTTGNQTGSSGNKTTTSNPLPTDTAPPVSQTPTQSTANPGYSTAVQPEGTGVKNVTPQN